MSIFVARQPIFDTGDRLCGYELLYRRDASVTAAGQEESNTMSARVIANVFLGMDIHELAGDVPGFVNITPEQLLEHTYELLDPASVVVELLETCRANADTLAAVRAMEAAGYTIALDDFEIEQSNDELLRLASIVKIDVLGRDPVELQRIVDHVRPHNVRILAERVETQEVYSRCAAMGFDLFQGYFHARPETVQTEDVEARQSSTIRLMNLLRDNGSSEAEIEAAFCADPALCHKLLRIANSAAMGGNGVDSIQHALRLVGRETLYRWLSVIFTASFAERGDTAKELVLLALARGRMCELVANRSAGRLGGSAMYMTGLLSRMDTLMRVPLHKILAGIDVAAPVRDALLDRIGSQAPVLILAEAYDQGDWKVVGQLSDSVGLPKETVAGLYVDSIRWAEQQFAGAS